MDFIHRMITGRTGAAQTEMIKRDAQRRKFCNPSSYTDIADKVMQHALATDFLHLDKTKEHLYFEGDERSAWLLRDWPPYDLPWDVRSYKAYLVALSDEEGTVRGRIVSVREWWSLGRVDIRLYDPDTFGDSTVEAMSVYMAAVELPHNHYFKKQYDPTEF